MLFLLPITLMSSRRDALWRTTHRLGCSAIPISCGLIWARDMKVALIGFGAIGTALAQALGETEHPIVGILGRIASLDALRNKVPSGVPVVTNANDLLALCPE